MRDGRVGRARIWMGIEWDSWDERIRREGKGEEGRGKDGGTYWLYSGRLFIQTPPHIEIVS